MPVNANKNNKKKHTHNKTEVGRMNRNRNRNRMSEGKKEESIIKMRNLTFGFCCQPNEN